MTTPMMQQYRDAKAKHPDMLLLFRMGDFYELFEDDAHAAHRVLGLTLTSRDKELAMAGFPHHQLETLSAQALAAGPSRRGVRSGRGRGAGQGPGQARGDARRHAGNDHGGRPARSEGEQSPGRDLADVPFGADRAGLAGRLHRPILRRRRSRRSAARGVGPAVAGRMHLPARPTPTRSPPSSSACRASPP